MRWSNRNKLQFLWRPTLIPFCLWAAKRATETRTSTWREYPLQARFGILPFTISENYACCTSIMPRNFEVAARAGSPMYPTRIQIRLLVVVVVGTCVLFSSSLLAASLCVNPNGTGGCYSTIQAAVTCRRSQQRDPRGNRYVPRNGIGDEGDFAAW